MSIRFKMWFGGVAAVATLVAFNSAAGQAQPQKGTTTAPRATAGAGAQIEATKGAAQDARRDVRETVQDTKRDARETAQDARRDARETAQDIRQDAREAARDATGAARDFAADNLRGADLGLWLNAQGNALVVSDIATQGAVAQLGFREGDRIISVNGQPVTSEQQFIQSILAPNFRNQQVTVAVFRDGQQQQVTVQPSALLQNVATFDPGYQYGFLVDDRVPDRMVVQRVFPRTPAFYWGLRAGDVITTVGGQPVASMNDLSLALQRSDVAVPLQISRNNQARQIQIDTSSIGARTALRPNLDAAGARLDGAATTGANATIDANTRAGTAATRGTATGTAAAGAQTDLPDAAGTRAVAPPASPTRPVTPGTPTRPGTPTAPSATTPATPGVRTPSTPLTPRPTTVTPAAPTSPIAPATRPATPGAGATPANPATPATPATPSATSPSSATPGATAPGAAPAASGTGTASAGASAGTSAGGTPK